MSRTYFLAAATAVAISAVSVDAATITLNSTIDLTQWNTAGSGVSMMGSAPNSGFVQRGDTVDLRIDFLGTQTLKITNPTRVDVYTAVDRPDFFSASSTLTYLGLSGPANASIPSSTPTICCILYSRFLPPNLTTGPGTIAFSGVRVIFSNINFLTPTGGTVVTRGFFEAVGDQFSIGTTVPEPASWMTMIAGFGLVGAAMRRRVFVAG